MIGLKSVKACLSFIADWPEMQLSVESHVPGTCQELCAPLWELRESHLLTLALSAVSQATIPGSWFKGIAMAV